jgi:hypothetical protein
MTTSMCMWCHRAPRQPHLMNCPVLTGIPSKTDYTAHATTKRTGAYLRRPREGNGTMFLPHVLYFVETRPAPDSPAALYQEDQHG